MLEPEDIIAGREYLYAENVLTPIRVRVANCVTMATRNGTVRHAFSGRWVRTDGTLGEVQSLDPTSFLEPADRIEPTAPAPTAKAGGPSPRRAAVLIALAGAAALAVLGLAPVAERLGHPALALLTIAGFTIGAVLGADATRRPRPTTRAVVVPAPRVGA